MKYIYNIDNLKNHNENTVFEEKIGKKAQNLLELAANGFNIPHFSVITNRYFKEVILKEIEMYNQEAGNNDEIKDWNAIFSINTERKIGNIIKIIKEHKIRKEFTEEIENSLNEKSYYAVRSSSVEEDSSNFSFAGQFETYLYVKKKNIIEKVKEVWISSFSSHVMKYRKEGKINNEINVPAVIIQEMINSDKAGVGFSVNPVNGNYDEAVISGTYGLGTSIVDGDENGDLFIYDKKTKKIKKEIRTKKVRQVLDFENQKIKTEEINIEEEVLTNDEIHELGENIINIEKYYGKPQDMEWAFEKGKLYILQARPITTLEKTNEKTINTIIWDNSNIVESYPEITLPLTFSFIRKAYSDVYKRFSEITGVPPKVVESYQVVYDNMLGLLKGRVYYNLINWYKLLMLFPNSKGNSKFMEQMMGVKKELSEENLNENLLEAEEKMTGWEKFRNRLEKYKAGFTLFINMFLIEKKAEKFYKIIDENLNGKNNNLDNKNIKELKKYYKFLENKFLKNWEIPIINDFLVMIWFGLSKKMAEKYIKENFEEKHNILIAQEGNDMISVEPSRYIKKMSNMLRQDNSLQNEIKTTIKNNDESRINVLKLTENTKFNFLFNEYMEKFGDRTVHELKLEAPTLKEEPIFLIKMIHSLSMTENIQEHTKRNISEEQKKIYDNLKISPVKKYLLKKTVFYAKKFIKLRENLRYERTKVFGTVRKIMKKIGTHLKNDNLINNEKDVFYLTVDEILGLVDGSIIDVDLKKLIELRKKEYKKYEAEAILPDRFLTRGFLGENFYYEDLTRNSQLDKNTLKGTGCSKGIVKGKVKIVLNPMNTQVEDGDIVVTKSTDPSWVMVFPLLKGLIVEKGSLLSHSAIISREMNIPAIVGVQGATTALKTGDIVQFDGSTGIIKKLDD
ncbi:PEP/pyruvate-binding domain-containing protein [Leptotrichia sp. oral taxon 879]|uniref:PEP/pyruvate-binding domain-containing protein n=1 Tax=Leptotrichia sp. oral taxon 879 TaxID=1227267 RepID=UPI0003AD9657|nr:PEP/pyruvate-binding domain-containing protein [Leptotrichia sp. oral taxon 879]ERK53174.1 pyruvate phosphate dikinase, PEP/pyruvate binding domain protein [Leptotrichia sp. oral taxon 879 str. F0557]